MNTFRVAALLCVCAATAFSQGTTAQMNGNITDASGAAVPGAEVTVTQTATDQSHKVTTSERGEWSVPALSAGVYRVTVLKSGVKAASVNDVSMIAGVPQTVNVKLEGGQATETITVSGGAEIIQATTAEVSSTVTGRQIFELPFATGN